MRLQSNDCSVEGPPLSEELVANSDPGPGKDKDDQEPQSRCLPVTESLKEPQVSDHNAVPQHLDDPTEEEKRTDSATCHKLAHKFHLEPPYD
jgi:hypothetical protein